MDSYEKKELIKSIAFDMFLNIGYEATTIRMICKEAGMEPPSIYNFFGSKKGLFLSISNDLWEKYKIISKSTFDRIKTEPLDVRLYEIYSFTVNYAINNIDDTRFFIRFSLFPPAEIISELFELLSEQERFKETAIRLIMKEGIQKGFIKSTEEQAAFSFMRFVKSASFDAIISQWRPDEKELKKTWNNFLSYNTDFNII